MIPKNSTVQSDVEDGTHSIFMIENDKIETDWKFALDQPMKESFFDIESLREHSDLIQGESSEHRRYIFGPTECASHFSLLFELCFVLRSSLVSELRRDCAT